MFALFFFFLRYEEGGGIFDHVREWFFKIFDKVKMIDWLLTIYEGYFAGIFQILYEK